MVVKIIAKTVPPMYWWSKQKLMTFFMTNSFVKEMLLLDIGTQMFSPPRTPLFSISTNQSFKVEINSNISSMPKTLVNRAKRFYSIRCRSIPSPAIFIS